MKVGVLTERARVKVELFLDYFEAIRLLLFDFSPVVVQQPEGVGKMCFRLQCTKST